MEIIFISTIFASFFLSMNIRVEDDLISGCCSWDTQLFYILSFSSDRGYLPLEVVLISSMLIFIWSHYLKFKLEGVADISNFWNILRSSCITGYLSLEVVLFQAFLIFFWSPKIKFKTWRKSNQCLLKYSFVWFLRLPFTRFEVFISSNFHFGLVPWA